MHPALPHLINLETTLASSFKQPLALWIQLTFIITFVESLQSSTNSSAASSRGSTSSYQVPQKPLRGVPIPFYLIRCHHPSTYLGFSPLSTVDLSMFAPSVCPGLATHFYVLPPKLLNEQVSSRFDVTKWNTTNRMDSVFNHCLFTFVCNVLQAHGVSFQASPKIL